MLGFELFVCNQLAQHTPPDFRDLGARLRYDADRGVQQAQRLEVIHDEQSDILRNAEADSSEWQG